MLEIFILWIIGALYVCGKYYALETIVSEAKGEPFNSKEAAHIIIIAIFIWPAILGITSTREFLFEKDALPNEGEPSNEKSL